MTSQHNIRTILVITLFSLSFYGCSNNDNKLKIAVAANAQFAISEMIKEFENESKIQCDLIVGSSGNLSAQIKNGAPYNVFLSADMKYPLDLYEAGLTVNQPQVYALGKLVLWSVKENVLVNKEVLTSSIIKNIALGNPPTAPYGRAANEVLDFWDYKKKISTKLVYGESISQVNHFILSKAVDIGFTSYSSVLANKTNDIGKYSLIDSRSYNPIKQGIVILNNDSTLIPYAQKFYYFMYSSKGKNILSKYGYGLDYE